MIIGEHNKAVDISANPSKEKKLTNMRAAGKDDSTVCSPVQPMTLERAINFIKDDEMLEVTPQSIRLHKRVLSLKKRENEAPRSKLRGIKAEFAEANPPSL